MIHDKNKPKQKIKEATATKQLKEKALELLKEVPLATYACQKLNIPKSTFYKWKKIDYSFREEVDNSINLGRQSVNDIAISQLMKKINNGETIPIIFWLKNNSPMFSEKVTLEIKSEKQGLSPEELHVVTRALVNMGIENTIKNNGKLHENFLRHIKDEVDKENKEEKDTMIKISDIKDNLDSVAKKKINSKKATTGIKRDGLKIKDLVKMLESGKL